MSWSTRVTLGSPTRDTCRYIICIVITFHLQFNIHYQPTKLGFSLVAEQRSNLLRKSRSPSFFKKNLTKKSSSPLQEQSIERRSPLRGPVHWEVQSIERGSPVRGPVRWRFSVEKTLHRYSSVRGAVHREVQSIERHSPLRGAVHWEAQSFERFSVVRGRRLQRREFYEKSEDKRNQKFQLDKNGIISVNLLKNQQLPLHRQK